MKMTPLQEQAATIGALIKKKTPYLKSIIQRGIDPERFAKVALAVISRNDKLLECSPNSLLVCLLQSAQLGLDLDPALGFAYMVPYKKVAKFITGYKGYMELARRSQGVTRIFAAVVRAGDDFDHQKGTDDWIHHKPVDDGAELTHTYAVAHFIPPALFEMAMRRGRSGAFEFQPSAATRESLVLRKVDVERFRARSQMGNSGAWVSDYEAMAMKTAIRRLAAWLPQNPQLARAGQLDDQADRGEEQEFGDLTEAIDIEPVQGASASTLDKLAAQLPAPAANLDDAQLKAAAERKAQPQPAAVEAKPREPGEEG